ncbi:MAG: site-2 protease family protein [Chloroflexi bacterium]|nr:site-2 protease family protein [Chloroflexota bacterium]
MNILAIIPILSIMMLVHELGHFLTARRAGIVVQEFGFGLPPRVFGITRGGVIYSLNWIPFGAFVKMLGEEDPTDEGSFASKGKLVRGIVLAAGSGMNFLLAVVVFAVAYFTGWPTEIPNTVTISRVADGSPAQAAGVKDGDVVVSLDGQTIPNLDDFRRITNANLGRSLALVVQRGSGEVTLTVTPRVSPPEGQGAMGVGIQSVTSVKGHGLVESVRFGFDRTVQVIGLTLSAPVMVLRGLLPADAVRPIGLPGMAQVAGDAAQAAVDTGLWFPLLTVTGMFSAGLAVANMLPIPALDGGRLLFVIIEAIRGRRVSPEREGVFHFVGIIVLVTLMVIISVNDIRNPLDAVNWSPR